MLQDALSAIRLKVTVDGKPYDSDLRPGDLVRYEEQTGKSLFGMGDVAPDVIEKAQLGTDEGTAEAAEAVAKMGLGMSDLFVLAYLGTRREVEYRDYDDFLDRVEDIAISGGDAPKGPPSST